MTSKRNRFYQIWFVASILVIVGLLAFMGITAIQKSMTLKMQFEVSPAVAVKLEIYNTTETKWETVFQNDANPKIKNGITLNGNTLGFRSEYANGLGNEFRLKLTSLSSSKILAEFGGASFSQSKLLFADSTSQIVEVDAVDNLTIDFSKVVQVSIQDSSNGGLTLASENLVEFTQDQQTTYYAKTHQALALVYDIKSSHENHSIEATISDKSVGEITTENNQMTLSIPATALTGSVSVTLSAEMNQLTVNYNGLTNINSTNTTTIMEPNTPYTTNLTVTNEADYTLPEEITVNIGGMDYNVPKNGSVEGITYDVTLDKTNYIFTGTLSIPGTLTTGDISLEGEGYIDYWGGPDANITELLYVDGSGSEADPYLIANGKQLASLINMDRAYYFRLIKNIYLNEGTVGETGGTVTSYIWTPLNLGDCPPVLFHGNMKTISGMYVVNVEDAGLFRNIGTGSSISELTFINSYIQGSDAAGALGGYLYGVDITISGITIGEEGNNTSVVIAGNRAGGIIGGINDTQNTSFISITNYSTITGVTRAGGIFGEAYMSDSYQCFKSCVNDGIVSGPLNYIGGLAGYISGTTTAKATYYDTNCVSTGTPTVLIGTAYDWD